MKLIFLLSLAMLYGCATIRLRYEVDVNVSADGKSGSKEAIVSSGKVTFEKSYPVDSQMILCLVSGVFYGGACWLYLGMPNSDQISVMKREAKYRIMERFEGKTVEYVRPGVS